MFPIGFISQNLWKLPQAEKDVALFSSSQIFALTTALKLKVGQMLIVSRSCSMRVAQSVGLLGQQLLSKTL